MTEMAYQKQVVEETALEQKQKRGAQTERSFVSLRKKALDRWGGLSMKKGLETAKEEKGRIWNPKPEHWPANVTDDDEAFGELHVGCQVEVLVDIADPLGKLYYDVDEEVEITLDWVMGGVIALRPDRVAVALEVGGTVDFQRGVGMVRKKQLSSDRTMVDTKDANAIAIFRSRRNYKGLVDYALEHVNKPATLAHAVITLSRMGRARQADEVIAHAVQKCGVKERSLPSTVWRAISHAHARSRNIHHAIKGAYKLQRPQSALLILESLALAMNATVEEEVKKRGSEQALQIREPDGFMESVLAAVEEGLLELEGLTVDIREWPEENNRDGLVAAFNQLLLSCGRCFAVHLAFKALQRMEAMRLMKNEDTYEAIGKNVVQRVNLLKKVWELPTMPAEGPPEVVFAGRSNVGKSSLVNMLTGVEALAPTSMRPGKTKTMHFFEVNDGHGMLPAFRLVDIPGLGFARVSQDMRKRWIELIGGYFIQRKSLKIVFHLLDSTLCEILPADIDLWRLLAQAKRSDFQLCICLTKADSCLPGQMTQFAHSVRKALAREGSELAVNATIFGCSAKSKLGKDTLWAKIWSHCFAEETGTLEEFSSGRARYENAMEFETDQEITESPFASKISEEKEWGEVDPGRMLDVLT